MPTHLSIDVDQTILDDNGELIAGVRENLQKLKDKELTLQLWSKGGADYAQKMAVKWKLECYFSSYAAKPDLAIDDLPEDAHPVCTLSIPFSEAAQKIISPAADSLETAICPTQKAVQLVEYLQRKQRAVQRDYSLILRSDRPLHPIPFFGNLESAQVLTVGLNPSSSEFETWRDWPTERFEPEILTRRLAAYFRLVRPRPHPWFADYQETLGIVGANYKINAAHIDLSPWATLSPTKLSRMHSRMDLLKRYNQMLELGQQRWIPRALAVCADCVKVVMVIDPNYRRSALTVSICKAKFGGGWTGEIVNFRNIFEAKSWAWNNRSRLMKKLGVSLYD